MSLVGPQIQKDGSQLYTTSLYTNLPLLIDFGPSLLQDIVKQAGAELGQAQLQLELGFTLIKVCCITLMITNYNYIS